MKKITSEIFQVGGGGLSAHEDAAVYLIRFGEEAALVDAGCGNARKKLMENIRACRVSPDQIRYMLITHCHFDHTGGVKGLKAEIPFKVVAHERDARFLEEGNSVVTAATWYGATLSPFTVDRKLSGSQTDIELGGRIIRAVHVPGHSPGSLVYLTESDGLKVLFAQDVHGPLDPDFLSDRNEYRKSLERMLALDADILCEGHYGVYRGKEEVRRFVRSFLV